MLDLFYPPKPKRHAPDLIYSSEFGKMTPEEKRIKDVKSASNLKDYLRRKALGKAPALARE